MKTTYNAHEKLAIILVKEAMSSIIGGYENTLLDFEDGDEEYKNAYEFLHSGHEELINAIYLEVMSCQKGYEKHLRFAGEKFIKDYISKRLTSWGY